MKKRSFSLFPVLFLLPFIVSAQKTDTSGAAVLFQKLMSGINPKYVNWVDSSAKTANDKNATETEVRKMTAQYATLAALNDADIETLVFLVMMEAAKDAQKDLEALVAQIKSINDKKKQLREVMEILKGRGGKISGIQFDSLSLLLRNNPELTINEKQTKSPTKAEIDELKKKIKKELDSLSESGEMESLKLQMAMDRMSKYMSTISNLLKKLRDIVEEMLKNLK